MICILIHLGKKAVFWSKDAGFSMETAAIYGIRKYGITVSTKNATTSAVHISERPFAN